MSSFILWDEVRDSEYRTRDRSFHITISCKDGFFYSSIEDYVSFQHVYFLHLFFFVFFVLSFLLSSPPNALFISHVIKVFEGKIYMHSKSFKNCRRKQSF